MPSTTLVAEPLSKVTKAPTSAKCALSVTVTVDDPLDVAKGFVRLAVLLIGVIS